MDPHCLLFALILPAIFMARGVLHMWLTRAAMLCLIALLIVTVVGLDFQNADGSLASVANCAGGIVCSVLALVGIVAPSKFFAAFRILGVVLFVRLLIGAMTSKDLEQGEAWSVTVFVGLPCLLFAWKARPLPPRQAFHVVLDVPHLPAAEQWQDFLHRAGFDVSFLAGLDAREHTGRLGVVFQGVAVDLGFEVVPLSQFIAETRMPDGFASRFEEGGIAAVFRYDDEHERLAAFVAAAALTKLSEGALFDDAQERWFNADEAMDEALDIVQPYELHVLAHDENLPTAEQWQSALNESGIAVASWEPFDIREHKGFLPLTVQEDTLGFSFVLSPAEFLVGGDLFPIDELPAEFDDKAVSADFRSGAGRHSLAVQLAAATFARLAKGTVYNPRTQTFSSGPDAFEEARAQVIDVH